MTIPLKPLNPIMHARYTPVLFPSPSERDPLPAGIRAEVGELLVRRATTAEGELDAVDAAIVERTFWFALRPDEIARDVLRLHGWRSPLTVEQAAVVIAACGEAGYPITGNGAPDFGGWGPGGVWAYPDHLPLRGEERNRVVWAAAKHWAQMASEHLTYVSLGDSRGFLPRAVQYDEPGRMHPMQRAALTFGPLADRGDECDSHGYMRRHTRRLILVAAE